MRPVPLPNTNAIVIALVGGSRKAPKACVKAIACQHPISQLNHHDLYSLRVAAGLDRSTARHRLESDGEQRRQDPSRTLQWPNLAANRRSLRRVQVHRPTLGKRLTAPWPRRNNVIDINGWHPCSIVH
nr:hypothetical protein [uncultured Mediterranean phage uvMED]